MHSWLTEVDHQIESEIENKTQVVRLTGRHVREFVADPVGSKLWEYFVAPELALFNFAADYHSSRHEEWLARGYEVFLAVAARSRGRPVARVIDDIESTAQCTVELDPLHGSRRFTKWRAVTYGGRVIYRRR